MNYQLCYRSAMPTLRAKLRRIVNYQLIILLFLENEIYCEDETEECCRMVPMEVLVLKHYMSHHCKDKQGYTFLNDLELNKGERSSIAFKTNSVSRHLTTILKECNSPGKGNDSNQRPIGRCTALL